MGDFLLAHLPKMLPGSSSDRLHATCISVRSMADQLRRVPSGCAPRPGQASPGARIVVTEGEQEFVSVTGSRVPVRLLKGGRRDLGFGKEEAENLKLRSELMMRIEELFAKSGMTQVEAAKLVGLTTPRLNALLKGKINLFSLDALVNIATRAGLSVRLQVRKAA